jgi:DedD protein
MDKQKTQRIIGILVIVAFVIVLIPLFFGKTDLSTEVANNKVLSVPGQQPEPSQTLAKADNNEGQTPEDSAILGATPTPVNNPSTDAQSTPIQGGDGETNTPNTTDNALISSKDNTDPNESNGATAESPTPVNEVNASNNAEQTTNGDSNDASVINITPEVADQINKKTEVTKTEISSKPETVTSSSKTSNPIENSAKTETPANQTALLSAEEQSSADEQSAAPIEQQPKSKSVSAKNELSEPSVSPKVKKHKVITAEKKQHSKVKPVNLSSTELAKLTSPAWVVQMGNFKDKSNARRLADKLRNAGYKAFTKEIKSAKGNVSTRVYIGPEFKQTVALQLSNKVEQEMKIHGIVVSIKPLAI